MLKYDSIDSKQKLSGVLFYAGLFINHVVVSSNELYIIQL